MSREHMPDKPTRETLLRAFGPTPDDFAQRIDDTLRRLTSEKEDRVVKRKLRLAPVLVLALALLAGAAVAAALYPRTAERFEGFYGEEFGAQLERGDSAQLNAALTLGDVVYTVSDVIWSDGVLYGTIVMAPAEGANIVLIPEDCELSDPAGYNIHYGEKAPEGAKSYLELARERGARIVLAKCVPDGYVIDGELKTGDIGYFDTAMTDGSIVSSFEVYGESGGIGRAPVYTLRLNPHNWEITPEGEWLREGEESTWLKADWNVQVEPTMKENAPEADAE